MKKFNMNIFAVGVVLCTFSFVLLNSCNSKSTKKLLNNSRELSPPSEVAFLDESQTHENPRMRYKVLSSKFNDKSEVWESIKNQLGDFNEKDYNRLYGYIYQQNIPTLQYGINTGSLTYENLAKWYLFRILKYETDPSKTLHSIISIMPDVIEQAKNADRIRGTHPIHGMPILLKDNINAKGQPTTAGAIALSSNSTQDATIVKNLRSKGAIILGKVNLSEWAYYFCDGCPLGYSAVGGQTLNPYGRMIFETGGSSAASGTAMAANYAAGAVGTETAGSILSPSSQNSVFGLKPSIGLLSRTGIVPISSTLDTPGPMTRTVMDNAIMLSAMAGEDPDDIATLGIVRNVEYHTLVGTSSKNQYTLGANKNYYESDSIYKIIVEKMKAQGATIIFFTPSEVALDGFVSVLDYDMKRDLPSYLSKYAAKNLPASSVSLIIDFNNQDSLLRSPYGQGRFISSRDNNTSTEDMDVIKLKLETETRASFNEQFNTYNLDAILSINNYDAAHAAMAKYPCLAMPMGYSEKGEPKAMTLIGRRFDEVKLIQIGHWFEKNIFTRIPPKGY